MLSENVELNIDNLQKSKCKVFLQKLKDKNVLADFKACHPSNKDNGMVPSTFFVKFLYFEDKNNIYHRKVVLGKRPKRDNSPKVKLS